MEGSTQEYILKLGIEDNFTSKSNNGIASTRTTKVFKESYVLYFNLPHVCQLNLKFLNYRLFDNYSDVLAHNYGFILSSSILYFDKLIPQYTLLKSKGVSGVYLDNLLLVYFPFRCI